MRGIGDMIRSEKFVPRRIADLMHSEKFVSRGICDLKGSGNPAFFRENFLIHDENRSENVVANSPDLLENLDDDIGDAANDLENLDDDNGNAGNDHVNAAPAIENPRQLFRKTDQFYRV